MHAQRKRLRQAGAFPPETEEHWQGVVLKAASTLGWLCYHTRFSWKSEPGYPDITLVRGARLIFAELKRDDKDPTPEQELWLKALGQVPAVEVYVWRPRDWDDVQRILR